MYLPSSIQIDYFIKIASFSLFGYFIILIEIILNSKSDKYIANTIGFHQNIGTTEYNCAERPTPKWVCKKIW